MSCTQDFNYNIKNPNKCDGCDKNCAFGYTLCKFGCHILPTINGKTIDWYINKDKELVYTAVPIYSTNIPEKQKSATIQLAYHIAQRCKFNKSR